MRQTSASLKNSIRLAPVRIALAAAVVVLGGCPAPKPKPKAPPVAAPKPKPKPKPKCEKLSEKCKAKGSTLLTVPKTNYAFNPPKGWLYARAIDDNPAIAQASDTGAVIVADSVEMEKSRFKRNRQRDDLASFLFEQVGAKILGRRPQHTGKIETEAGQKATLREYERSSRGESKGSALVVTIELKKRMMVIAVFAPAPKDDSSDDTNIISSIRSLREVEGKAAESSKSEDSDKGTGKAK